MEAEGRRGVRIWECRAIVVWGDEAVGGTARVVVPSFSLRDVMVRGGSVAVPWTVRCGMACHEGVTAMPEGS